MPGRTRRPKPSPEKLSIVVFSGDFERVHYALATAAAAVAVDTPVTLFFTMGGLRALLRPGADGRPGWRAMPATGGEDGGAVDDRFRARGVATFEELIAACAALGVRFMVCEMGLRALGLTKASLRDDVAIAEGGMVSFLNDASRHGAMLFV